MSTIALVIVLPLKPDFADMPPCLNSSAISLASPLREPRPSYDKRAYRSRVESPRSRTNSLDG